METEGDHSKEGKSSAFTQPRTCFLFLPKFEVVYKTTLIKASEKKTLSSILVEKRGQIGIYKQLQ